MELQIVAAIIDSVVVTTDLVRIDACSGMGCRVEFITRRGAKSLAKGENSSRWEALTRAPTLMLCENGALFRRHRSSNR